MNDAFKQRLRDNGQSLTAPRLAIFNFLQDHDPTSVADVIAHLEGRIDRASAYRTLGLFRRLGIVQDIVTGGKRLIELTDNFDRHHHHLSCLQCGAITTIDDPAIERRLDHIAEAAGYQPLSHQIEVSGLCPKCRTRARKRITAA